MKHYWTVPELWHAATFVCIGGGPSLTPAQVDAVRGRARVIAINDAYKLAPWADVLYFCDDKWWQWHARHLGGWAGLIVRLQGANHDFGDARIKVVKNYGRIAQDDTPPKRPAGPKGLCPMRDGLFHGRNSGYQAINLAVHLGAKRIVLLGYDMRVASERGMPRTHWFGDHPGGTSPRVFEDMLPNFDAMVQPLAERGIEVLNATPGSKLRCFPMVPLEQALPAAIEAAAPA